MPILLIILLGYIVRRASKFGGDFFKALNSLAFKIFLPINLFVSVYNIEDLSAMNFKVIGFLMLCIPLCLFTGVICEKLFVKDKNQKSCIVQAAFRSNQAIIGLPLAQGLGGVEAVAFASLTTGLGVPIFNALVIIVLTYYSSAAESHSFSAIFKKVLKNPLIIGAMAGIVCVLIRQFIPVENGIPVFSIKNQLPSLYSALGSVSKVASPIMLFCLGAGFNFKAAGHLMPQISLGVFLRLIWSPAIVITLALLFKDFLGVSLTEMPSIVSFSASPVAVSSVVMIQELGGDDELARQLVVWSSILSMLTIFVIVALLRGLAFL